MPRLLRIAIMIVAVAATLGVAAAATSSAHIHGDSGANSCDICLVAHTVSHRATPTLHLLVAPALKHRVFAAAAESTGYELFLSSASLSRGPPSSR